MTAPLRQPTGDRHQIGGVEWVRQGAFWVAVAHGRMLRAHESDGSLVPEWRGKGIWGLWDGDSPSAAPPSLTLAHAMRNAVAWARRNPASKSSARRARAVFEALVGRAG